MEYKDVMGILCFLLIIGLVIAVVVLACRPQKNSETRIEREGNYHTPEFQYLPQFQVKNIADLRKHFVLDNPNENGSDPTGGSVNYQTMFPVDSKGRPIPNVNGDLSWSEIPEKADLLEDSPTGFSVNIGKALVNGSVAAPRLMSRKLFLGGLFIFDVEHIPVGCGVWPALWLNGFVGGKDQYHESKTGPNYQSSMNKLSIATKGTGSAQSKLCSAKETSFTGKPDPMMSDFLGTPAYMAMWPSGGEIDIIEQTNFAEKNLVSIHGSSECEVADGFKNDYASSVSKAYQQAQVRSVCGTTWSGFGEYVGCKDTLHEVGENGGATMTLPNGATRFRCPAEAADNAGNSQVVGPQNSYGEPFNMNGGGVYALEWVPGKKVEIWFWSRKYFTQESLEKSGMPLSANPAPSNWNPYQRPTIQNGPRQKQLVLIASYLLNGKNQMSNGCFFNFQGIIINIALGGGFGAGTMPGYCSVKNKSEFSDYFAKCFGANPEAANENGGVDPANGCYDGAGSESFRGVHSKAVFYSEAYFKFRQIRVLQRDPQKDSVW